MLLPRSLSLLAHSRSASSSKQVPSRHDFCVRRSLRAPPRLPPALRSPMPQFDVRDDAPHAVHVCLNGRGARCCDASEPLHAELLPTRFGDVPLNPWAGAGDDFPSVLEGHLGRPAWAALTSLLTALCHSRAECPPPCCCLEAAACCRLPLYEGGTLKALEKVAAEVAAATQLTATAETWSYEAWEGAAREPGEEAFRPPGPQRRVLYLRLAVPGAPPRVARPDVFSPGGAGFATLGPGAPVGSALLNGDGGASNGALPLAPQPGEEPSTDAAAPPPLSDAEVANLALLQSSAAEHLKSLSTPPPTQRFSRGNSEQGTPRAGATPRGGGTSTPKAGSTPRSGGGLSDGAGGGGGTPRATAGAAVAVAVASPTGSEAASPPPLPEEEK